jgi:hypothetical protein
MTQSQPPPVNAPPDHCRTCGQHNTACAAIGPKFEATDGITHCSLRDIDPTMPTDSYRFDKLKLAQLPTKQFDTVIQAASTFGCLSHLPKDGIEAFKHQFAHHRDAIKESLGVAKTTA